MLSRGNLSGVRLTMAASKKATVAQEVVPALTIATGRLSRERPLNIRKTAFPMAAARAQTKPGQEMSLRAGPAITNRPIRVSSKAAIRFLSGCTPRKESLLL